MSSCNNEQDDGGDNSESEDKFSIDASDRIDENSLKEQFINISEYIPITKMIEKDSMGLAPPNYDLTQKIMIIYGIAALLNKIHEQESSKANITPNYILLNSKFEPYINLENLNADSESQNANDFVFFNAKFKSYFPPEIIDNNVKSIIDDQESKMKADVFIFGALCLSIMTKKNFEENADLFTISQDSFDDQIISESLKYLIEICWNDPSKRPTFSAILKSITNETFIKDLNHFDVNKFKKYQKKVVDKEFIEEINYNFDITSSLSARLYSYNDFNIKTVIGFGMTGDVFKAENIKTGDIVALKKIKDELDNEDKMRSFREIQIFACTDHYAVQKLYGYIKDDDENGPPSILTHYEANGNLAKQIQNKKKYQNLDFTQKLIIMYGIASGMYYLHTRCILHRDLKPENILLSENFEPLITDFGLSKFEKKNDGYQSFKLLGTPSYMAPELLETSMDAFFSIYDAKLSDVYSFGVIIFSLFSGSPPWANDEKAKYEVPAGERPKFPDNFPHIIRLLVEACWAQKPKDRPTFEEILHIIDHPVFTDNIEEEFDMTKFQDYRRKVLIESYITDDIFGSQCTKSTRASTYIRGVKFPRIDRSILYMKNDFNNIPNTDMNEIRNPFFNVKLIEKDGCLYNQIKIRDEYSQDENIIFHLSTQIQVLLNIDHPCLNSLYGIINFTPKIVYRKNAKDLYDIFPRADDCVPELATPFMRNGTLLTNHSIFTVTQKFIIIYGIAAGMYYLHKKGMTHLNLKPENIFLNEEYEPIINIDITSRPKPVKENLFYLLPAFSFPYVAPELLKFQNSKSTDCNEKKADVYSFSMIVYFLMAGIHPWDSSRGLQSILTRVRKGQRPINEGFIPSPFDKLIEECWSTNPLKRLSFKNILNKIGSSDFIRSIEQLDVIKFQKYQKKVVPDEFIFPIQICSIRKRNEFEIGKMVGNGSFGNIMLAIDKSNSSNKVVCREVSSIYNDFVEKQKNILSGLNFPSIISLYGFIEPDEEKKESVILIPYAENGDLKTMIENENKEKVPDGWNYTQKCIVMYGVAMGMYKLHSHNITHQDLKPENILLNAKFEPWITDFALSKFVDPNQSVDQTASIGSYYYMAPEAFINRKNKTEYDEKLADVYSFGMLVFFLMTGIQPFQAKSNPADLMNRISNGERPRIPSFISQKMKDLIISCWNSDPIKRPTFEQILEIVCYESFYKSKKYEFNDQKFYDYQVELGDPNFIKYNDDSIRSFQHSGSNSREIVFKTPSQVKLISPEYILTEMADKGHIESQYRLGCMLRDGEESQRNLKKAAKYFKSAAEQDHIDAIISYSICLKEGLGVHHNKEEAFKWIQKAIDKDSIDALIILASWYTTDRDFHHYRMALELLEQAKEKGHPDAPALIGSLIEKKKLSSILTGQEIMELYNQSCLLGSYEGMYHMATYYHYGTIVDKNTSEACRLYNLVAKNQCFNHNRNAAIFSLSTLYEEIGEYNMAFKFADFYREKDIFVGYYKCADLYERGIGVEKNEEKAREYLNIAKEKRFKTDQLRIALLYSRGKGVLYNKEKFFYWTEISANNGSSLAQANLSYYYLNTKKDLGKAEEWGKKSAEAGNQRGMWNLARIYGAMKNDEKEIYYLEKLVKSGFDRAFVELGLKYKEMNKTNEAIEQFKLAAGKKLPSGIFHYGNELFHGNIIDQNLERGLEMIKNAAEIGYKKAMKKLIDIYSKGQNGIPQDREIANKYQQALDQMLRHSPH